MFYAITRLNSGLQLFRLLGTHSYPVDSTLAGVRHVMAPKKAAESKRKAKLEDEADVEDEDESPPQKKPRAKPKAKAAPKTEPYDAENGWHIVPPSLIWKSYGDAQGSEKIAAFDWDGTIAVHKGTAKFPTNADDWKLFSKTVPKELQALSESGHKIVIFSNQGAIKSALDGKAADMRMKRADNIAKEVPFHIFYATNQDDNRKPGTGMWQYFSQHCNDSVAPDLKESFFCGDAAGRPGDIQDLGSSDKEYAANVGVSFKVPEDVFGPGDHKKDAPDTRTGDSKNYEMANAFRDAAQKLSADGKPFPAKAFANVASILDNWPEKVTSSKMLKGTKGVGKGSLAKIELYLETGSLDETKEKIEEGVEEAKKQEKTPEAAADMAMKFL